MRVGIIHSSYRNDSSSGESSTVDTISRILLNLGYAVSFFKNSNQWKNSPIDNFQALMQQYSRQLHENFDSFLNDSDVVQIHNTFPALSAVKMKAIIERELPVVKVVQNYRLSCLSGLHFRNGNNCFNCDWANGLGDGLRYRCYQDSRVKSSVVYRHSKAFQDFLVKSPSFYVAISEHVRQYLLKLGISEDRVITIPNSVNPGQRITNNSKQEIFYCGELSTHKGADLILGAWAKNTSLPNIHVVGDGKLMPNFLDLAQVDSRVKVYGKLQEVDREAVAAMCTVALIPSAWEEPFGKVVIEALSRGQFIIASKSGGIAELLDDKTGITFQPNLESFELVFKNFESRYSRFDSDYNHLIWKTNFSVPVITKKWQNFYEMVF